MPRVDAGLQSTKNSSEKNYIHDIRGKYNHSKLKKQQASKVSLYVCLELDYLSFYE